MSQTLHGGSDPKKRVATPRHREEARIDFQTIIFATDFSLSSQAAGNYSAICAELFSARLIVAHAFTLNQAALEVEVDSSLVSQQRKDLEVLLAQKASSLASGSAGAHPLLEDGNPEDVLIRLADHYHPSLLVLGTRGEGIVKRKIIGSVAEQVLRHAHQPVLIVGPNVRPLPQPFRRLLFATDLHKGAKRIARLAVLLACKLEAELDVLNVIEPRNAEHPESLQEITSRFYAGLDALVPDRKKDFCHPRTFVEAGNAHQQILHHVEERSIDLLILGVARTSGLGMKRKTSGAFHLIREAKCPVLTIPAEK